METPENGEASEKTHGASNQTKLGLHCHLQIILILPINNNGDHYHHHGHLQIIVIMSINNNSDLQISVIILNMTMHGEDHPILVTFWSFSTTS